MTVEEGREYVRATADVHGLAAECVEAYDGYMASGDTTPEQAAWCALYDWDI